MQSWYIVIYNDDLAKTFVSFKISFQALSEYDKMHDAVAIISQIYKWCSAY